MTAATAATLTRLRAEVDAMRPLPPALADMLTAHEQRELDVLALGYLRARERAAERQAREARVRQGRRLAVERAAFARVREPALIASLSDASAAVQHWQGTIGAEGRLTGDGRLIELDALTWAAFPLPLRWAPVDWGGHDGAVLVGLIHAVQRRDDGTIWGSGVLDLGSDMGREAVRLIRLGMLSGVSMDLDSVDAEHAEVLTTDGENITEGSATVTRGGRVRAATLVAIPAFAEARIALTDAPDVMRLADADSPPPEDCGCATSTSTIHVGPIPNTPTERHPA